MARLPNPGESRRLVALSPWVFLLFAICFGLGYPTLGRYDPRSSAGLSDSMQYYKLVEQGPEAAIGHFKYRILVPYLAKPIYWVARGRLGSQVKFLKGWFKNTLPCAAGAQLAVLRMDGDLYESTMDILNALYHKVSVGGFVIVDDYHVLPPCKQAVHDFRTQARVGEPLQEIDGTAVFWKKSG